MLFKRSQKDMPRQCFFFVRIYSTSWIEMENFRPFISTSGCCGTLGACARDCALVFADDGLWRSFVTWHGWSFHGFTHDRDLGDSESFSPRHGDARADARGGSNPTSCQQRDKNSDPPCSLALALAAQSKRNITMQWCWCKMAVGVNDLWTKHMKSNVSISCEKTCLEINFKSWKIQGFSGTPSSLLPEDLGECLFEAENEGDFLGCQ